LGTGLEDDRQRESEYDDSGLRLFHWRLLAWLPGKWKKLGIEPSQRAVEEAATKGVQIIGPTVGAVTKLEERPGTITLFDVLEHVAEPLRFLDQLKRLLAPGGCILVMTGATDTFPWRLFGRHYWYCSLPEHVSFFSLKWFRWAAAELGFTVERHHYLSSESRVTRLWVKQALQASAFATVQKLREAGWSERGLASLPGLGRVAHWRSVPWWKQATDHIMVLLRA
jgi:SAM-dependent methyltransferase